jgi:hypothetical protein
MLIGDVLMIYQFCQDLDKVVEVYVIRDEVCYALTFTFVPKKLFESKNENATMFGKVFCRIEIS